MTIAESDIHIRISGGSVGAGNTDPDQALGGPMTSTDLVDNTAENLFDHTSGAESTAGDVEYRCCFVYMDHDTITYQGAKLWIDSETNHANANIKIALDLAGLNADADIVSTENEAPSPALTFVEANGEGNALTLGNMTPNSRYAFWVERTITAGCLAKNAYTTVFKVKGQSAEA